MTPSQSRRGTARSPAPTPVGDRAPPWEPGRPAPAHGSSPRTPTATPCTAATARRRSGAISEGGGSGSLPNHPDAPVHRGILVHFGGHHLLQRELLLDGELLEALVRR